MSNTAKTVVLVADDEPSTRALVAGHLRSKGYRVIEASDGDEAWHLAHEHLPDCVVLDVMMPGMSGWEVCRKIREAVSLSHTGVVMLTGIGENLNEMTSPLYGADAYLDKPFEFVKLDQKVKETLARRSAAAAYESPTQVATAKPSRPAKPSKPAKSAPTKPTTEPAAKKTAKAKTKAPSAKTAKAKSAPAPKKKTAKKASAPKKKTPAKKKPTAPKKKPPAKKRAAKKTKMSKQPTKKTPAKAPGKNPPGKKKAPGKQAPVRAPGKKKTPAKAPGKKKAPARSARR